MTTQEERRAAHIAKVLSEAPPLTDKQRVRLAAIFAGAVTE